MSLSTPIPALELTRPGEATRIPIRVLTFPPQMDIAPDFDWDRLPKYEDCASSLAQLLRRCMSDAASGEQATSDEDATSCEEDTNDEGFLPTAILERILSQDVVRREVEKMKPATGPIINVMFHGLNMNLKSGDGAETYFLIFALLALVGRLSAVDDFIETRNGPSDQDLPLSLQRFKDGRRQLFRRDEKRQMQCFSNWKDHELVNFHGFQWRLRVPVFALNEDRTIKHYKLHRLDILPWLPVNEETLEGGEGVVTKVRIHPLCHEYHELLKSINASGGVFAIKTLKKPDPEKFDKEVGFLKKYNGLTHDHLVTLLATFEQPIQQQQIQRGMIFPAAECDVESYWEHQMPNPNAEDISLVRWVAKQCRGMMEAMNIVHNSTKNTTLSEKQQEEILFGRHGDLKPENILWYRPSDPSTYGIWVISDFGLAAFHRKASRSMIPNNGISWTPGYRPPECDIEGGTISRAFDIWTLGCFYLEMLCWFLGGWELKAQFDEDRTTPFINGTNINVFFDVQVDSCNDRAHIFQLKQEVLTMIDKLHCHPKCTEYTHDLLDMIEEDMLLVIAVSRRRKTSEELLQKLDEVNQKCSNWDYCMKSTLRKRLPPAQRLIGTRGRLNNEGLRMVEQNAMQGKLSTHKSENPVLLCPGQNL